MTAIAMLPVVTLALVALVQGAAVPTAISGSMKAVHGNTVAAFPHEFKCVPTTIVLAAFLKTVAQTGTAPEHPQTSCPMPHAWHNRPASTSLTSEPPSHTLDLRPIIRTHTRSFSGRSLPPAVCVRDQRDGQDPDTRSRPAPHQGAGCRDIAPNPCFTGLDGTALPCVLANATHCRRGGVEHL